METGEIECCGVSKYVEWKINNFSTLMGQQHGYIQSPPFSFVGATWHFQIYPHAERGNFAWLSVYLWKKCPEITEHSITGWLGMKKGNGTAYVTHSFQHKYDADYQSGGIAQFLERASLKRDWAIIAPHDEVTFFCSLLCTCEGCKEAETQTTQHEGIYKLAQDFKELLLNGKDCDTTIKIADREFQAHRLILGARSPVFASMYGHDTTERSTGIVEIEDCDPEAFQDFLAFMYSGKMEISSSDKAHNLYVVTDKYDVQEIKQECLKFMTNNITSDNFCDTATLALKYGESELYDLAAEFFVKNATEIAITPKWLCFHKLYPVESNELYLRALQYSYTAPKRSL